MYILLYNYVKNDHVAFIPDICLLHLFMTYTCDQPCNDALLTLQSLYGTYAEHPVYNILEYLT